MASTSSGIINASVGPRIKKRVQEIVSLYPEEYRTISDFVTKSLQELIAKYDKTDDFRVSPDLSIVAEPGLNYEYKSANRSQVIQKLAEISEERAKAAIKKDNHTAAEEHYKEAAEYYKQLLTETKEQPSD